MKKLLPQINLGLLSSSLYVAFQIFANVLSIKIVALPVLGWAVDGGTIIYPLTFTLRDFVHKTWGKTNARQVVIIAGLLNGVMAILFYLIGKMTPDPSWQQQAAYEQILMPVSRIVIASIIAQIISELIDTEIFSLIYKKINDTSAVFLSNLISLLFDSVIFSFIAFLGVLPLTTVLQIVLSNILIKFIISSISVPTIKLIPRQAPFEEM
jgi:hypothetical protein